MFTATLLLLAILAGWIVWETVALSVKYVDIPIKGLPPELDGFRFAQMSDLHGKQFDPTGREAQAIIRAGVTVLENNHVRINRGVGGFFWRA